MTTNKMQKTWFMAATGMLAGGIALLVACSSNTVQTLPDDDGGASSDDSGNPLTDGGGSSSGDGGGSSSGDSGKDAGSCSAKPTVGKGPFCPFAFPKNNDAGLGPNCAQGETCCWGLTGVGDAGFDPSSCVANAAACPAPSAPTKEKMVFECQETSDCTTGVCCIVPDTKDGKKPQLPGSQCATLITNAGTRCKASCDADDTVACQTDAECNGKTCVLGKAAFGQVILGACK